MMKTFVIMFTVLTIVNIPILLIYQSNTTHNDFLALNQFFKYFTIGNLGQSDNVCDYSQINLLNVDDTLKPMNFTCKHGKYI